jgi:hypothetical protein
MNGQIEEFLVELRADRQAAKDQEQREAWTKYATLSIVGIAVLAAVSSQLGGGYSSNTMASLNEATYYQTQASDQWAFFQSKSIKQSITEDELLQAQRAGEEKTVESLKSKIARYDKEKAEISEKAKGFEQKRNDYREAAARSSAKDDKMGLSVSLFQIAIAIGSICLVIKKKSSWYISLAITAAATAQMIYAFTLP